MPTPTWSVMPQRRDTKFGLSADNISTWLQGSPHLSHFLNTFSLFLPVGERFFIASMLPYRDRIRDPQLAQAVTAFMHQEALHGREHREWNCLLHATIPGTPEFEKSVGTLLNRVLKRLPPSYSLSATIALEHLTAILADAVLRDERMLAGGDPRFVSLLRWHALEETEHKAVAYDLYREVVGSGLYAYLLRIVSQLIAMFIFWSLALSEYVRILKVSGELGNWKGWCKWIYHFFIQSAFMPKVGLEWLKYFKPGFHPWDHDNRHLLTALEHYTQRAS